MVGTWDFGQIITISNILLYAMDITKFIVTTSNT